MGAAVNQTKIFWRAMRGLQMPRRIHLLMQNADYENCERRDRVVDRVTIDEQDAVPLADVIAAETQLGVARQKADTSIQLVEILVCLVRAPLGAAELPDTY
jgi:hypothetical protein